MSSECRLFTSRVRSDVQRDLGRERSYTTTNDDFRSATWAGELAADIISGSESFPATALLPCGPAMAAARGKSNGNWARHSLECGGAEEDGLSFFRSSPCCAIPCSQGPLPTEERCTASVTVVVVADEYLGYNALLQANDASDDSRGFKKPEASIA